MAQNDLKIFDISSLPFEAIPFHQIKTEHYLPALNTALELSKKALDKARNNPEPPTFANTCVAIESISEDINLVSSVFYNQLSSDTNDTLQSLANEIGPLLSQFSNDVILDEKLFARVQTLYSRRSDLKLTPEEYELLDSQYKDFVRNGANLNESQKSSLREIDAEMAKLSPQFSDHVLKATNAFTLHVTDAAEIAGLPPTVTTAAQHEATNRNLSGWVFTLQAPSYIPFMMYAEARKHRETMYKAYLKRAFNDSFDNQKNLLRIVELREKRARLLGFATHADFVLEQRMAETQKTVFDFLKKIENASLGAARKEVETIKNFAVTLGGPKDFQAWDFSFYSEKLKEKTFAFSNEELRPYFPLETVLRGVFMHAEKLYDLQFKENLEIPKYHKDVRAFEVYDISRKSPENYIGLFYVDLFPRPSKKGGAWMTAYRNQGLLKGQVRRPHIAIVCSFTPPTADTPSLLTFDEVNTLFHEFGHALHGLLSHCRYTSLAGTNVRWDFVELPSQIMENWLIEQESLNLVSGHYKTGEKIPASLARKIKDSSRFLAGYMSLRQATFATLDMAWHTTRFSDIKDVSEFEQKNISHLRVLPHVDGTNFSCGFTHIFAGGYSAGYYSYKWAEVLDADAFELFKERGIFDKSTAQKFRTCILEKGGTEHPMKLFKDFRGREPDPDALLRRDGLLT